MNTTQTAAQSTVTLTAADAVAVPGARYRLMRVYIGNDEDGWSVRQVGLYGSQHYVEGHGKAAATALRDRLNREANATRSGQ